MREHRVRLRCVEVTWTDLPITIAIDKYTDLIPVVGKEVRRVHVKLNPGLRHMAPVDAMQHLLVD